MSPVNQGLPEFSAPVFAETALRRRRGGRNLAALLFDEFASKIRSGLLPPGEKLPTESALVQTYEVSRTVVREAISRLQAAQLVQTRHGIGTFVATLLDAADMAGTLRLHADELPAAVDVMALLEFRIGLETEGAALAAQRRSDAQLVCIARAHADFEAALQAGHAEKNTAERDTADHDLRFHLGIASASGNRYFGAVLQHFGSALIPRVRIAAIGQPQRDPDYLRRISREHEAILTAIARQDIDSARAAMRIHLTNSRERLRLACGQAQR